MHFSESPWPKPGSHGGFGHRSDQKTNFRSAGVCLRQNSVLRRWSKHEKLRTSQDNNVIFDAPKSSSVVSDNIYCQQTFLAFFCKGSQGMKMPMPSRHHQNLQRLNFRLSSVYLQNHRPWKLYSSCNSTQLPPIWRRIPCFSFAKPWISKQARQLQSWKNFNFSIL